MIDSSYIKDIIANNRDSIAFIIGNGIHRQYNDCRVSWESLLMDLCRKYVGDKRSVPKGISFTEFYDIIELNYYWSNTPTNNTQKGSYTNKLRGEIKREVADIFPRRDEYALRQCIEGIKRINAPILTTNFDTYISNSVNASLRELKPTDKQYKLSYFYPWNMYYSDREINDSLDGFAVWHINGTNDYYSSIRLGLSDYMGCVERARKMIQGNNTEEYFTGKNQSYWVGYNTWLHIIFNKSLFIFGLGLEENEVFLRWLLIQRAKYSKMYNKNLKGWYIDKLIINSGKRFFLEQLGFEVIDISNYNMLYNALEDCSNG